MSSKWTPFSDPDFGGARDRRIYEWAKAKRNESLRRGFWFGFVLGSAAATSVATVWATTIQ